MPAWRLWRQPSTVEWKKWMDSRDRQGKRIEHLLQELRTKVQALRAWTGAYSSLRLMSLTNVAASIVVLHFTGRFCISCLLLSTEVMMHNVHLILSQAFGQGAFRRLCVLPKVQVQTYGLHTYGLRVIFNAHSALPFSCVWLHILNHNRGSECHVFLNRLWI